MAVLGGLLLRQPRTVQGLGKPYLIRGYLSGVNHGAKAGESRPRGQLLLVRRKFGLRRLSRFGPVTAEIPEKTNGQLATLTPRQLT